MDESEQMPALRWAFSEYRFVFRVHAHFEAMVDRLTTEQVRAAGEGAELLEEYPDRPQGYTKLLLGYAGPDQPVHLVANVAAFEDDASEPIVLVTVYQPEPPGWRDERTRGGTQ